jgi:hypothetical protein
MRKDITGGKKGCPEKWNEDQVSKVFPCALTAHLLGE